MKKCKSICGLLLLTLNMSVLAGCGQLEKVEQTTISVDKDGEVTEVIMESVKDADYTIEELQSFVEKDIEAFNEGRASDGAVLESCERQDGKTRIEIVYPSYQDYADYHHTTFFMGTLQEAVNAGYEINSEFRDANGNTVASATILSGSLKWNILILEEPVQVFLPGEILYASKNAEITDKKEVKIVVEGGDENTVTTRTPVYLIYK